jgi:hypothetical protein
MGSGAAVGRAGRRPWARGAAVGGGTAAGRQRRPAVCGQHGGAGMGVERVVKETERNKKGHDGGYFK